MDCGYFESNSSISLTQLDAQGVLDPLSKMPAILFGLYMLLAWRNADLMRTRCMKNVIDLHTWRRHMAAKLVSVDSCWVLINENESRFFILAMVFTIRYLQKWPKCAMVKDLSHIENRQHIHSLLWRILQFVAPQILHYQAWYKFEDFRILLPRMPDVIPEFFIIYWPRIAGNKGFSV